MQVKSTSVTLFTTLALPHSLPEGYHHNHLHILVDCRKACVHFSIYHHLIIMG